MMGMAPLPKAYHQNQTNKSKRCHIGQKRYQLGQKRYQLQTRYQTKTETRRKKDTRLAKKIPATPNRYQIGGSER